MQGRESSEAWAESGSDQVKLKTSQDDSDSLSLTLISGMNQQHTGSKPRKLPEQLLCTSDVRFIYCTSGWLGQVLSLARKTSVQFGELAMENWKNLLIKSIKKKNIDNDNKIHDNRYHPKFVICHLLITECFSDQFCG